MHLSDTVVNSLPISEYNRSYLLRMLPHLDYYLDIYRHCIQGMESLVSRPLSECTVVDYGGGHGLLSVMLKECGVGRVVYVDYNPRSVEAARTLSAYLGMGPDVLIEGDHETLTDYCRTHGVVPHALLGMDVIEHIYRLDCFFDAVCALNPEMVMLFTTGSNPCNPFVRRRLHRVMLADEVRPGGFRDQRRSFIAQCYPEMSAGCLDQWARDTRGLVFDDCRQAVSGGHHVPLADKYNTCDPATGSWTERILPFSTYRGLLAPYGFSLRVSNGFYNTYRPHLRGILARGLNLLLRLPIAVPLAPFVVLTVIRAKH